MKKVLSMVLVLAMISGLCACSGKGEKSVAKPETDIVNPESNNEKNNEPEEVSDKSEADVKDADAFANSKETFVESINKLVDDSDYDISEQDDSVAYSLVYKKTVPFNFDYKIKFDDGKSITLPTTYDKMKKAGWTTEMPEDEGISNRVTTGVEYTNDDGESFLLWTQNPDDSDDEKMIPLKDCKLYEFEVYMYSEKTKKDDSGEYVKYYEENETPGFSICGGITADSSIADVIEILGQPSNITYYAKSNKINISFREKLDNWYSSVSMSFVEGGKYMSDIRYEYSYAD